MTTDHVDLAVVGGGIAGLAAAWEARSQGASVVVLEASDVVGGKLGTSSVGGVLVDESADAFLARRPEALTLCAEVGIEDKLVAPATGQAYVWLPADQRLRPLPAEQLLGIPTDVDAVASSGILSPEGIEELVGRQSRSARDRSTSGSASLADVSVGGLVRRELGDEVYDRLVAPLIGGIWAGDCDRLSVEVAAPAIAEARRQGPGLVSGAQAVRAVAQGNDRPVFLAPDGGMAALVDALSRQLGDGIRLNQSVERITPRSPTRSPSSPGWMVEPAGVTAGAVVLTSAAWVSADLLGQISPRAARSLATIEHASVVLVTMVVPREGIRHPLDGSGFLVPESAGLLLTACSWASSKWARLAGDGSQVILRVSAGRDGQERPLELSDEELVRRLCADLRLTMGLEAPPTEVRINRFWHGFPQPRPGHLGLVEGIEQTLSEDAPTIAVAGAWARGVGIPACIGSGRLAVSTVLAPGPDLRRHPPTY